MRTLVVVLGLLFTVSLASGSLLPEDEASYWKDTSLDIGFLRERLSDALCASGASYLKSCRAALVVANRLLGSDLIKESDGFDLAVNRMETAPLAKIPRQMFYAKVAEAQLQSVDPHAQLIPTRWRAASVSQHDHRYLGLGFGQMVTAAGTYIHQVYPNTSAARAGLQVHDQIVSVNGQAGGQFSSESLLGARLRLTLVREGRTFNRTLAVGAVSYPLFASEVLSGLGQPMGYSRVSRFVEGICDHVRMALRGREPGVRGWILDLRGNPGGLIEEAKCLAGLFLPDGTRVVGQRSLNLTLPMPEYRDLGHSEAREVVWELTRESAGNLNLPLVVLVDQSSASSSELVAGSLQDYSRAWIVGEPTFGKATTQYVEPFPGHEDMTLIHTEAIFLRPSGRSHQIVGITPDYIVPFRKGASEAERQVAREKDLFPNSSLVPPDLTEEQSDFSTPEKLNLRLCVDRLSAQKVWKVLPREIRVDEQLVKALLILKCSDHAT